MDSNETDGLDYEEFMHQAEEHAQEQATQLEDLMARLLETPELRPLFSDCASDPLLAEGHSRAMAWGQAHPNATYERMQAALAEEDEP